MFTTASSHQRPFLNALTGMWPFRSRMALTPARGRVLDLEDETSRGRDPSRGPDELALLAAEGCVTDWGLLESAARLRSGWP